MHHDDSISINLAGDKNTPVLTLPLSSASCWSRLLGQWPLPIDGSLDRLVAGIDTLTQPPDAVTLIGCPSACLLPILWLRSIWLAPEAKIHLDWQNPIDPRDHPGRQAAGKLACLLATSVTCSDPELAMSRWGLSMDDLQHTDAKHTEAFDLLTNLIDLWGAGPKYASPAVGWAEAARKAIVTCSSLGLNRIAIYGAGTHTRAIGDVLMEPDAEIVAIIDDDTHRHGTRMWGYPIISPESALEMKLDAVILSANSVEDLLWERTAKLREAGVRVARLYSADA